jgi:hypothetical protein
VSNEQATFAVNVGGDFEQRLLGGADAGDKLADSLDADLVALKAMQSALRNLQGGSLGATNEARRLKEQITAQKASIAGTQAQLLQMGAGLRRTGKASKESAADQVKGMQAMVAQLQGSNTAIGSMLTQTRALTASLGKAGVAGAAALVVVAFAAVTAAIGAATVALASYALRVVDARRSEMIRLEGLTKIPNWFGIIAGKASDMQAAITRVSSAVALGRDKIVGFAESLYRAGLRGRNLDQALEGTAIRASVLGDDMGSAFASMAAGAALTGQSIQQMVQRTKNQLGGLAARQMLSFTVQLQKARENIDALFTGVKIEGFLSKFATLTELFSQSTATGRALKVMLETLLNPLFGSANSGAPILKRLFQGMVIGALAASIAIVRLRLWWRDTFGQIRTNINWTNVAVYTGIALFGIMALSLITLTGVVLALGGAMALVFGASVLTLGLPLVLFGAAVVGVVYAFKYLITWGKRAYEYLKGIGWSTVGASILQGILNPLGALYEAGLRLGKRMVSGFKAAWESRSPSRLAARIVDQDIGAGLEIGSRKAGPRAGKALGKMMSEGMRGESSGGASYPTSYPSGAGASVSVSQGSGGVTHVTIERLEVNVTPRSGDNPTMVRSVADEFARMLETALLQMGAATT